MELSGCASAAYGRSPSGQVDRLTDTDSAWADASGQTDQLRALTPAVSLSGLSRWFVSLSDCGTGPEARISNYYDFVRL